MKCSIGRWLSGLVIVASLGSLAAHASQVTLFINQMNAPGAVTLSSVTSAWSVSAVLFASLPTVGAQVATFTPGASGTYVTFDVTAAVQGWARRR